MYATRDELEERFGVDAVLMAADREGDGEADNGAIERALNDATAEIDGYVGVRYNLPLTQESPVLKSLCLDMAMWKLALDTTATEQQEKRYNQAVRTLKLISDGKVTLGLPQRETPVQSYASVQTGRNHFGHRRW